MHAKHLRLEAVEFLKGFEEDYDSKVPLRGQPVAVVDIKWTASLAKKWTFMKQYREICHFRKNEKNKKRARLKDRTHIFGLGSHIERCVFCQPYVCTIFSIYVVAT